MTVVRREFLRNSLALAAGAVALPAELVGLTRSPSAAPAGEGEWRNRQAGMKYRRLGRTGFMVSEIVCGGDPIAPDNRRHVEVAFERGSQLPRHRSGLRAGKERGRVRRGPPRGR